MKKGLLEIYALSVCFVALVCFVISLGIGIYDIVEITSPEFTLRTYVYEKHQTNKMFTRNWPEGKPLLSDEEITKQRKESYTIAIRTERRDALQSFTRVTIIILIDIVVFFVHWKIAKRAGESANI